MDDLISRQAAIDIDGLDVEIRCSMCENPMHTNKGCDGNCKYDEKLYEKIIQILDERIKPLPSAQPEPSDVARSIAAIIENEQDMRVVLKNAQNDIIRCKDCMYGEQDDAGWWYCRSFGCQVGNKDGSGFCADAERRTDEY